MNGRSYSYNDALMLAAGKVIIANLRKNIKELVEIRSKWTRGFTTNLEDRIDYAFSSIFGIDVGAINRYILFDYQASVCDAAKLLLLLKLQVEMDYANDVQKRDELLHRLKLAQLPSSLDSLSDNDVISLLKCYVDTMPLCSRKELVYKGIGEGLVVRLSKLYQELVEMKKVQMALSLKGWNLNEQQLAIVNEIYHEINGVCELSSIYFGDSPKKLRCFSMDEITAHLEGICGQ